MFGGLGGGLRERAPYRRSAPRTATALASAADWEGWGRCGEDAQPVQKRAGLAVMLCANPCAGFIGKHRQFGLWDNRTFENWHIESMVEVWRAPPEVLSIIFGDSITPSFLSDLTPGPLGCVRSHMPEANAPG